MNEEKKEMCEQEELEDYTELFISGDCMWRKRGITSLFDVSIVVGYYSNKGLNFIVKSSFYKACEFWNNKKDTIDYEEWRHKEHEKECLTNHEGSFGKMEVDAKFFQDLCNVMESNM